MDIVLRRKIKYTLYWSSVLLLLIFVATKYVLPSSGNIDLANKLWPIVEHLKYPMLIGFVTGLILHKCDICNKQLLGFVFTKKCCRCNGNS